MLSSAGPGASHDHPPDRRANFCTASTATSPILYPIANRKRSDPLIRPQESPSTTIPESPVNTEPESQHPTTTSNEPYPEHELAPASEAAAAQHNPAPETILPERSPAMGRDADAVLRVGRLLLGAGTDAYRVVRAMKRCARSLGFDQFDASISLTSIRFTARRGAQFRTAVCVIKQPGIDSSLIEKIEYLSHHLPDTITAEWLNRHMDAIEKRHHRRWSKPAMTVAAGLACAGFAVLNSFSWSAVAAVAVAAAVGQAVRMELGGRRFNQLGAAAFAGIAACLTYFVLVRGAEALLHGGWAVPSGFLESGYVASVLFLVPGFPLFTSLLDLARLDISAGWERFLYACSLIISATMAAWAVTAVTGLSPSQPPHIEETEWVWLVTAALASIVGIAGFAVLFNSSRRMLLVAAMVGAVANCVKFVLLHLGVPSQLSCLVGGLCIGFIGSAMKSRVHVPRITITIPAAVIMIPGVEMFRSMYYLNIGNITEALTHCATSALQVFAIASGLVISRLVTDRDWALNRHIDFSRHPDHSVEDTQDNVSSVTWFGGDEPVEAR